MRPLTGFGMPEHVRISVGLPEENERLVKTLQRLREERCVTPVFERVAVIGPGPAGRIGGARGEGERCGGPGRRRDASARRAGGGAARGASSTTSARPEEAARGADLVVLATPSSPWRRRSRKRRAAPSRGRVRDRRRQREGACCTRRCRGCCRAGVATSARIRWRAATSADSSTRGPISSRELPASSPKRRAGDAGAGSSCDFWRALGARVVVRDPAAHDAEVAWMSHVPARAGLRLRGVAGRAPAGGARGRRGGIPRLHAHRAQRARAVGRHPHGESQGARRAAPGGGGGARRLSDARSRRTMRRRWSKIPRRAARCRGFANGRETRRVTDSRPRR